MAPPRRRAVLAALILAASAGWLCARVFFPPGLIETHERAWRDARNKIRDNAYDNSPSSGWDYLRPRTWLWYWQGKPVREEVWQQFNDHEKELVRLGVFASETVFLTNHVYQEAMTNRSSFLNGPHGIESDDSSGIKLAGPREFLISGKSAWVSEIAGAFRKWDSDRRSDPK
jgi:hypothetical protein